MPYDYLTPRERRQRKIAERMSIVALVMALLAVIGAAYLAVQTIASL